MSPDRISPLFRSCRQAFHDRPATCVTLTQDVISHMLYTWLEDRQVEW